MEPWKPDDNLHQARRIGKTLEELGELSAVLARISIQGIDAIDPSSGKSNRQRMEEEMSDVSAQLEINLYYFNLNISYMSERMVKKQKQMSEWEKHFD